MLSPVRFFKTKWKRNPPFNCCSASPKLDNSKFLAVLFSQKSLVIQSLACGRVLLFTSLWSFSKNQRIKFGNQINLYQEVGIQWKTLKEHKLLLVCLWLKWILNNEQCFFLYDVTQCLLIKIVCYRKYGTPVIPQQKINLN